MHRLPDIELTDLEFLPIRHTRIKVKWLASGAFSTAYRGVQNPNRIFLLTHSEIDCHEPSHYSDLSKYILQDAKRLHNNKHLPVLRERGVVEYRGCIHTIWETRDSKSFHPLRTSAISEQIDSLSQLIPHKGYQDPENIPHCSKYHTLTGAIRDIAVAASKYEKTETFRGLKHRFFWYYDLGDNNFGISKHVILRDPIVAYYKPANFV